MLFRSPNPKKDIHVLKNLRHFNTDTFLADLCPKRLEHILVPDGLKDLLIDLEIVSGGEAECSQNPERIVEEGLEGWQRCSNDASF